MVWIGNKKFSKEVFHLSRWKVSWDNGIFDLLGIKFPVNLEEIKDLSYILKLLEIQKNNKSIEINPNRTNNGY